MPKDAKSESQTSERSELLLAFSRGLAAELDRLGYPPDPKRSLALAKDLGLGRMQAYRLLKGLGGPNPESQVALRHIGVSFDRILDGLNPDHFDETIDIKMNGRTVVAVPQKADTEIFNSVVAILQGDGSYELKAMVPGEAIPPQALPIRALRFSAQATIAVVEDDAKTLEVLTAQMRKSFGVVPFAAGLELLNFERGINGFHAFLIDWRLPDVKGEALIQSIRQRSQAPIFILTGDASASASIAKVMDGVNVHHVAKPADDIILIKRMSTAISAHRSAAATGTSFKPA